MSYEDMTKREAILAYRKAKEDLGNLQQAHEAICRLHEAATDRNVHLAAVIENIRHDYQLALTQMWVPESFREAVRTQIEDAETTRPLRQVRSRVLFDVAEDLEDRHIAAISSAALRSRATGILVGVVK